MTNRRAFIRGLLGLGAAAALPAPVIYVLAPPGGWRSSGNLYVPYNRLVYELAAATQIPVQRLYGQSVSDEVLKDFERVYSYRPQPGEVNHLFLNVLAYKYGIEETKNESL